MKLGQGATFAFLLAPLLLSLASANEEPTKSLHGVMDLDAKSFDLYVTGKKHALVEFYAPWCGHCKRLTPEFKILGERVASDPVLKNQVMIAKIDADAHSEASQRFGVKGFPTLKWFSRGKSIDEPIDYEGGRTADAMLSFIRNKIKEDKTFARVGVLDSIAEKLSGSVEAEDLIKEVESKVDELTGTEKEHGELYLRVMRKAVEKGPSYFETEHARITKILDSGKLSQEKADELNKKASVLTAFINVQ